MDRGLVRQGMFTRENSGDNLQSDIRECPGKDVHAQEWRFSNFYPRGWTLGCY